MQIRNETGHFGPNAAQPLHFRFKSRNSQGIRLKTPQKTNLAARDPFFEPRKSQNNLFIAGFMLQTTVGHHALAACKAAQRQHLRRAAGDFVVQRQLVQESLQQVIIGVGITLLLRVLLVEDICHLPWQIPDCLRTRAQKQRFV